MHLLADAPLKILAFSKVVVRGLVCLLFAVLAACGGGEGSGNITLTTSEEKPDPVVLEIPIAYIKRPLPDAESDNNSLAVNNLFDPVQLFPGARLFVRNRSSSQSEEVELTDRIVEIIAAEEGVEADELAVDIKDLDVSFDGKTLIFAVRAIPDIENNDEPELHTWNLWTYNFETDTVNYLISSRLVRNEGASSGGGQDMAPHFLTDDRIVFSSTRQSAVQERQLNEGRGQRYSAVSILDNNVQAVALHVYDPDSGDIAQISLSQTLDVDAAARQSGEVVFSRLNRNRQISLYQINPSGARLTPLYGSESGDLVAREESTQGNSERIHFLQPRELPNGRIMTLLRSNAEDQLGGDIALINTDGFAELFTAIRGYEGTDTRAQTPLSTIEINALDPLSPGGRYLTAYPLRDGTNRVLVSWSSCKVINGEQSIIPCSIMTFDDRITPEGESEPRFVAAPPTYGIWIFDPDEGTQLPVILAEAGFVVSEIIAAEPRNFPTIPDEEGVFDPVLASENKGKIVINSVYNQDGQLANFGPLGIAAYSEPGTVPYSNRPARFLRVLQPIPIPNDDVLDDQPNSGGVYPLQEIIGYVPIEPDGSVTVKVPANTPLLLNVTNADGRRIGNRQQEFVQVAPGEILRTTGIPSGRLDNQPPSLNPGAVSLGSGLEGFVGTDPALFASELGQSMADVYELRKPDNDTSLTVRDLQLQITYSDEWTDRGRLTPDGDIDLSYDSNWDIDPAYPIIAPNLDPALQGRIVIHYDDHIQPIWERSRVITQEGFQVLAPDGTAATSCVSCHSSLGNTVVPAGQLELTGEEVADVGDGIFTRSYLELTRADNELWITSTNGVADRQRICTETDADGNTLTTTEFFRVNPSVNRGSALASRAFFNCFEVNNSANCGAFMQDTSAPPANCSDDGGMVDSGGSLTTKEIPESFADAQALMATLDPPLSLTDEPQLMFLLRANCSNCHSRLGGLVPHSDSDDNIAYNSLRNYINLVNPAASTFVFRLATLNHQCGTADQCASLAMLVEQAITNLADAVPAEEISNVVPGGSVSEQGAFNHYNLLTPSELRLISEWMDSGTPFYNNPFDPRLYD